MWQHLARRLLASIPVFFIVTAGLFFLLQLSGADAAVALTAGEASPEQVEAVRKEFGLDRPVIVQYGDWLWGAVRGDLGRSITKAQLPVAGQIRGHLPVTVELAAIALLVSLSIAIPVGVLSAVRRNSAVDYIASFLALFGVSIPGFALAFLAIYAFSIKLHWVPIQGYAHLWDDPARNLRVMLLPGVVLGAELAGVVTRLTRSTVLEALHEDYVRTAHAKGLRERAVVIRHVLRNALLPVVTVVGIQLGILVGGAFVIEVIFGLPGMGKLLVNAITARDVYLIEGVLLLVTLMFISANLAVDLLYAMLDPRIRYG
jgi:peptide/nickel transport system permease protein